MLVAFQFALQPANVVPKRPGVVGLVVELAAIILTSELCDPCPESRIRSPKVGRLSGTGLPTVADDSGLEVVALGGMPGVLSSAKVIDRLIPDMDGTGNQLDPIAGTHARA